MAAMAAAATAEWDYFITVGTIYDPFFKSNYSNGLQTYLNRLQWAYDTAKQGIWSLPRPAQEDVLKRWSDPWDPSRRPGPWRPGPWADGSGVARNINPRGLNPTFYRLYGVVSLYGEYFEVGNYPPAAQLSLPLNLPEPPPPLPLLGLVPPLPDDYFLKFYAGFDLKIIAASKITYRQLGLGVTRTAINGLRAIVEGRQITDFDPDMWWSLREISGPLASAFPDDPANPSLVRVTLRTAISRLNALSGAPQQSLRTAFESLVLPIRT
jgi:hypothetical protein